MELWTSKNFYESLQVYIDLLLPMVCELYYNTVNIYNYSMFFFFIFLGIIIIIYLSLCELYYYYIFFSGGIVGTLP